MRCATLAAALADSGHFATVRSGEIPDFVVRRLEHQRVSFTVIGEDRPLDEIPLPDADLVVIDGYGLGGIAERLKSAGRRLAMIDDNGELPVELADVVVNQNLHASEVDYSRVRGVVLAGADFALVRSEVVGLSVQSRRQPPLDVLVAVGGTDPIGLTLPLVRKIQDLDPAVIADIHVAVPAHHADTSMLLKTIDEFRRVRQADASLTESLAVVGLAVIGAGSTMWEVATLGIPAIVAVVAENQIAGAAVVEIARVVGEISRSAERRQLIASAGRGHFDGQGVARVVDQLVIVAGASGQTIS
jgi:UDP-2,4-diacetamido-2,4,6-trideoxy-beta-L-altropyranose hydrolase